MGEINVGLYTQALAEFGLVPVLWAHVSLSTVKSGILLEQDCCQIRTVQELSDFHLRLLRHVEATLLYGQLRS
jgi:hypothetical protein